MSEQTIIQRSRSLRARAQKTDQHTDLVKAQGRCCWEREEAMGMLEEMESALQTVSGELSEVARMVFDFARKLSRGAETGHAWEKLFKDRETAMQFRQEFYKIVHHLRGMSQLKKPS